jgi:hypothetical protein
MTICWRTCGAMRIKQTPTGYRLDPPKTINLGHGDRGISLALAVLGARRFSLPSTGPGGDAGAVRRAALGVRPSA